MPNTETVERSYTFTKNNAPAIKFRGEVPEFDPPSSYQDEYERKGIKRWKKVGYKINPFVDEVEPPQVLLVNRRLKKIGEIVNISDFRHTLKELNQANEISFTVTKELNGFEQPFYDRISDLGVVYVNGEFFEIGISNHEDASIQKNVVGVSLGYAELSQIITSVQINTDEDLLRDELNPFRERFDCGTIFYNPVQIGDIDSNEDEGKPQVKDWRKLTSMLERILSQAPHYKVGTVDKTLRNIKRTFSWEDTDIVSILNDIGQEVGCVFDIVVTYDADGSPLRLVNAYDLCYCKYCWDQVEGQNEEFSTSGDTYRNIQNGVCLNCKGTIDVNTGLERTGAEDIFDIGTNTGIFLSTENLTDDITVDGNKDEIKTSFKITGGDDIMTATVQGLNPSGVNRIMLFPEYMMKNFSPELYDAYTTYRETNKVAEEPYTELLENIYALQQIQLYLKSGRMPVFDEPITEADLAFSEIAIKINNNFHNTYYIDKINHFTEYAVQSSIYKMMKTFVPKGFGIKVEVSSINENNWLFDGSITVYSTSDSEDIITVDKHGSVINVYSGSNKQQYTGKYLNDIVNFARQITFRFSDFGNNLDYAGYIESYSGYIESYCSELLSKNDIEYSNEKEKDWSQYSYERLKNWYDGYSSCIDILNSMYQSAETDFEKTKLSEMITTYSDIQECITRQLQIIKNQLYAIGKFLGDLDDMFKDSEGKELIYAYQGTVDQYMNTRFANNSAAINSLIDTERDEQSGLPRTYEPACDIGVYPFKCKKCGSTNVRRLADNTCHCRNCKNTDENEMITYHSITTDVINFYNNFNKFISDLALALGTAKGDVANMKDELLKKCDKNNPTLYGLRDAINDIMNIHTFMDDNLYSELMSFVREQVYSNENYISEGLTDEELIQQAKELQTKAKRELARACMPQYSISASVGSIVALEPYEYLGETYNTDLANFAINNYIHVKMDDDIYKLRISSIELTYPMSDRISVTFTNAERYVNGYSSDIASILSNAQSMATSFDAIATQSEKGVIANNIFDRIKQGGLDTSLMAVNGGRNQDVLIDDHGILLRMFNEYTGLYDDHQTKMINNNIVMTDDNWKTAKLAIGLTLNPEWSEAIARGKNTTDINKYLYGVYADAIVGDLIISKHMRRVGNGVGDECTVDINKDGITIRKGMFDVGDGKGNNVLLDPCNMKNGGNITSKYNMIEVMSNHKNVFYIDNGGNAFFSGEIQAKSGHIASWKIDQIGIHSDTVGDGFIGIEKSTTYNGSYFGPDGLRIGNNFAVDSNGFLTANGGKFTGTVYATDGEFTGKVYASDGEFTGIVNAKNGQIGGWKISGSSLIGLYNTAHTKIPAIMSSDRKNTKMWPNETTPEGGFYISEEGLSVGNFFIETSGSSGGMMTLPKCRVMPFMHTEFGLCPGNIQFLGSIKAKRSNLTPEPSLDFGGKDKTRGDTLYLTYNITGDPDSTNDFIKNIYNCLEIRNKWTEKGVNTFPSNDNKYLGGLRASNIMIGKHSLKHILNKLYKKVYGDGHEIDYEKWDGYK